MLTNQFVKEVRLLRSRVPTFDEYPFSLAVVRRLDVLALHPKVTYLTGENGSGKSTLLEAIAVALGFNAEGGTKNFRFITRKSHSILSEYIRVSRGAQRPRDGFFLRAESFFNVATEIEDLDSERFAGPRIIDAFGGKSLHEQSHGESFLALFLTRLRGSGLYILDEPEAALSPQSQLGILARIHELIRQGSQFIIATHSPVLLAYPEATIYECSNQGLAQVNYVETASFRVMKSFMDQRERVIQLLLNNVKE